MDYSVGLAQSQRVLKQRNMLGIVALARPKWGAFERAGVEPSREILIALDLSRSMRVEDVRPSRLRTSMIARSVRSMVVDDVPLDPAEAQMLLDAASDLVKLRGQWVRADPGALRRAARFLGAAAGAVDELGAR